MKKLALLSIVAFGFTACGSSGGVAATATQGDTFCKLAQNAKDDNDTFSNTDPSDPAKIKLDLSAAIDTLTIAVAKAPKDIAETAKALLAKEAQLEKLLKANDYDFAKMSATDEGKALIDDASSSTLGDDFDKYLSDKCGIATSDTTSPDTTPSDTTPGATTPSDSTVSNDSTASGDTSVDTIVDLGEGEAAINKFLDFYELGTGAKLTSEQRSCIVDKLKDTVTGSELNQAIAGQASSDLQQTLGLAFIECKVTVQS